MSPAVAMNMSFPTPPINRSLPASPSRVSLPTPPLIVSAPALPTMRLFSVLPVSVWAIAFVAMRFSMLRPRRTQRYSSAPRRYPVQVLHDHVSGGRQVDIIAMPPISRSSPAPPSSVVADTAVDRVRASIADDAVVDQRVCPSRVGDRVGRNEVLDVEAENERRTGRPDLVDTLVQKLNHHVARVGDVDIVTRPPIRRSMPWPPSMVSLPPRRRAYQPRKTRKARSPRFRCHGDGDDFGRYRRSVCGGDDDLINIIPVLVCGHRIAGRPLEGEDASGRIDAEQRPIRAAH